jgi:hypothetical protein
MVTRRSAPHAGIFGLHHQKRLELALTDKQFAYRWSDVINNKVTHTFSPEMQVRCS